MKLSFKQCWVAPYQNAGGPLTYCTYGLSSEGWVYRWDGKCSGWLPQNMEVAECLEDHPECGIRKNIEKKKKTNGSKFSLSKLYIADGYGISKEKKNN